MLCHCCLFLLAFPVCPAVCICGGAFRVRAMYIAHFGNKDGSNVCCSFW
uniref:Uncharacterized protein n=1 Tax=Arundo donax TaxID=35708 RepID=A0A0A9E078_ARUDO